MSLKHAMSKSFHCARASFVALIIVQLALGGPLAAPMRADDEHETKSPIKHVIVIIGENRTFDHVFATYKPKDGETVDNLLSKGIVKDDGTPGPNYSLASQFSADATTSKSFQESLGSKTLYPHLPAPLTGGPSDVCVNNFGTKTGMCTVAQTMSSENGLPLDYYPSMIIGGTGLPGRTPDTRINGVSSLPSGPFQLTNPKTFPYTSYAASPVHRFYQMWQQFDCNGKNGTAKNPSGCDADLFPWVEVTVGAAGNGEPPPAHFSTDYAPAPTVTTGEGSTSMGFYNMQQGDAPYLKFLADHYAMSDNFHQSVMGGTGANHIMLGTGDAIWYSDGKGNAMTPPHNTTPGNIDEVENPNPLSGTNNWYTEDGYGGGGFVFGAPPLFGGGSYSDCSDPGQPGVAAILAYLASLKRPINPNCEANHYYLLNNYNPGYFGDGSNASTDTNAANTPFTIPPSTVRNIGDELLEKHISWKYYGDQWNAYVGRHGLKADPYQLNYGTVGKTSDQYCNICNFFQSSISIMTNKDVREEHLKDTLDLYDDIEDGTLPAVSFVKPSGWVDGHPASSKLDLFEGFVKKIVDELKKRPELWKDTAIFVTFDEGGGYYDSGYVQAVDFFGDGTRIPLILISPYTKPGHISHDYSDHVSILKFIERNWDLEPLTNRSRDNLANPKYNGSEYVPANSPAIGDLFDLFDFDHHDSGISVKDHDDGSDHGHDGGDRDQ
jgi:phospholipase C